MGDRADRASSAITYLIHDKVLDMFEFEKIIRKSGKNFDKPRHAGSGKPADIIVVSADKEWVVKEDRLFKSKTAFSATLRGLLNILF